MVDKRLKRYLNLMTWHLNLLQIGFLGLHKSWMLFSRAKIAVCCYPYPNRTIFVHMDLSPFETKGSLLPCVPVQVFLFTIDFDTGAVVPVSLFTILDTLLVVILLWPGISKVRLSILNPNFLFFASFPRLLCKPHCICGTFGTGLGGNCNEKRLAFFLKRKISSVSLL